MGCHHQDVLEGQHVALLDRWMIEGVGFGRRPLHDAKYTEETALNAILNLVRRSMLSNRPHSMTPTYYWRSVACDLAPVADARAHVGKMVENDPAITLQK